MKPFFTAAALLIATLPAFAQDEIVCMPTEEAEAALVDWYGETPVSGDVEGGHLLWAAGIGQSWTLLSYEPDGTSCTVAEGDDWSPQTFGDDKVAELVRQKSDI